LGYEADVLPYLDIAYEHVCTCQEDAKFIANMLGVGDRELTVMASCSEHSQTVKADIDAKKEEFVTKIKEANVRAVEEAAAAVRTQEMEGTLEIVFAEGGAAGERKLEEYTIDLFNDYKE
jgi:hypothetical protein